MHAKICDFRADGKILWRANSKILKFRQQNCSSATTDGTTPINDTPKRPYLKFIKSQWKKGTPTKAIFSGHKQLFSTGGFCIPPPWWLGLIRADCLWANLRQTKFWIKAELLWANLSWAELVFIFISERFLSKWLTHRYVLDKI